MVIQSILENDLYKFSMSHYYQVRYPNAWGTFTFHDRNNTRYSEEFVTPLKEEFGRLATLSLQPTDFGAIEIPGNRPYKVPGGIPIWPTASRKCNGCGACAKRCPTGAIDLAAPKGVNKEKCIKCGRCIVVCPTKARRFYGIKYSLAAARFNTAFAARRANEMWFASTRL